jgi:hypothetical protein
MAKLDMNKVSLVSQRWSTIWAITGSSRKGCPCRVCQLFLMFGQAGQPDNPTLL